MNEQDRYLITDSCAKVMDAYLVTIECNSTQPALAGLIVFVRDLLNSVRGNNIPAVQRGIARLTRGIIDGYGPLNDAYRQLTGKEGDPRSLLDILYDIYSDLALIGTHIENNLQLFAGQQRPFSSAVLVNSSFSSQPPPSGVSPHAQYVRQGDAGPKRGRGGALV